MSYEFRGESVMYEAIEGHSEFNDNDVDPIDAFYCSECDPPQFLGNQHDFDEGGIQHHIEFHQAQEKKTKKKSTVKVKRIIIGHPDNEEHSKHLNKKPGHTKQDIGFLEKTMKLKISEKNKQKAI